MYRLFLTILLCLKAASSAPQAKESDVTYVKIQPVVEDALVAAASNLRESRIEKLPLTIPGNVTKADSKEDRDELDIPSKTDLTQIKPDLSENKSDTIESKSDLSENKSDTIESKFDLSENKSDSTESKPELSETKSENLTESLDLSESKQSESLSEVSATNEASTVTTDDLPETSPTDDASDTDLHLSSSDTIPSETNLSDRHARNFDSVETTETAEDVTEKYEDELIDHTAIEAPRTRAPPKFVPKGPKLSYFQKPKFYNRYSLNLLENGTKRRFRSHCSCQKIWNCPKLQISVPRCPNEYFLCCF